MLTTTLHDLRYAFRALLKNRNFTLAALVTLALGIGINTGMFTLLYAVAFRPLPVKDPDQVVKVYQILEGEFSRQVEGNVALLSYPEWVGPYSIVLTTERSVPPAVAGGSIYNRLHDREVSTTCGSGWVDPCQ